MASTAIGIDIGGTHLRAARVSDGGEILDRVAERTVRDPEAVVARILDLIRRLDRPSVAAIGIGVPGRVDAGRGTVLSGGYVDLSQVRLAERVAAAAGRPVAIDNDGTMALVAEIAVGAAQGHESVALLTIGTGIGGAIAEGGRILRGRRAAGQLGHVTIDAGGERCACGRLGCVETVSSGTALGRHVAAAGLPAGTSADRLFALEAAGDPAARRALLAWATPLRAAIESIVAVADPDLVLLGGGLGAAAQRALALVPAAADWFCCPVEAAALGDDAGVIGAALCGLMDRVCDLHPVRAPSPREVA
ncbi:ROK family protein [Labrys wisconsinensis]|uniref:Glucokinase n=1 Tax=Labrys wisconsinensis TaxID=425677 RepID=A0ABU0JJU2_9HYPH|nr:ROK family protein [Labrys wisconsinensis]MDQ0474560.1 glucokinase [Labrys wisconsinensis]